MTAAWSLVLPPAGLTTPTHQPRLVFIIARPHAEKGMHFLVVDDRFGTPIYVILESDPGEARGFPTLQVREVTLEARVGPSAAVGRDPARLDRFREFRSEGAVAGAGFILI